MIKNWEKHGTLKYYMKQSPRTETSTWVYIVESMLDKGLFVKLSIREWKHKRGEKLVCGTTAFSGGQRAMTVLLDQRARNEIMSETTLFFHQIVCYKMKERFDSATKHF